MGTPAVGAVVLVTFPFSDLSRAKLRRAIILAGVGRGDWILCQVTSNPYGDSAAIAIEDHQFETGSLQRTSYARPGKLFTASESLISATVGLLFRESIDRVIDDQGFNNNVGRQKSGSASGSAGQAGTSTGPTWMRMSVWRGC